MRIFLDTPAVSCAMMMLVNTIAWRGRMLKRNEVWLWTWMLLLNVLFAVAAMEFTISALEGQPPCPYGPICMWIGNFWLTLKVGLLVYDDMYRPEMASIMADYVRMYEDADDDLIGLKMRAKRYFNNGKDPEEETTDYVPFHRSFFWTHRKR